MIALRMYTLNNGIGSVTDMADIVGTSRQNLYRWHEGGKKHLINTLMYGCVRVRYSKDDSPLFPTKSADEHCEDEGLNGLKELAWICDLSESKLRYWCDHKRRIFMVVVLGARRYRDEQLVKPEPVSFI